MSKYGHRTINWFEAIVNKLGGEKGAERFLRGEITVTESSRPRREQDGIIYFSVTSDGTTGSEWIKRLKDKGFRISNQVKSLLNSSDFKSTTDVISEIAVLKGKLFSVRAYANKQNLTIPNAEIACLIREKFTDEDIKAMGLYWIITMHAIDDSGSGPWLLGMPRYGDDHWLPAFYSEPGYRWSHDGGFAFVHSQV